ncbi:MAG TPA: hypothetical protein DDW65_21685 [Firmicutes bacterium]|nr:hypothetical protein [Bacillota bacterium]
MCKKGTVSVETIADSIIITADPPNPDFTVELKALIPANDREWSKDDDCWYISIKHKDTINDLCNKYFSEVQI